MQTATRRSFDYDMPLIQTPTSACQIRQAWAKVADTPDRETAGRLKDEIKALLKEKNAVLVAHYYVDPLIQDLALETGGCVGDSLEMARFGAEHEAGTLVVAGVRFMGESAKILCPEKTVLMPDLEAECSLDLGCPEEAFSAFCDQHPDRTVVVYANTSAAVKARADWVVTSSVALEIVSYLKSRGEKLIWGPDRHLGDYIRRETGADMLLWQGSCIVHNEFKGQELSALKAEHPDAVVLVHPESPQSVIELGDVVGSTSKLLKAAVSRPEKKFIVATDLGIELSRALYYSKKHHPRLPHVHVNKPKMWLLNGLMWAFLLGGVVGAWGYHKIGHHFALPVSAILFILGAGSVGYDVKVRVKFALAGWYRRHRAKPR